MDLLSTAGYIRKEGKHKVKVVEVESKLSENKIKTLVVTFEDEKKFRVTDTFYITDAAGWKILELVNALGWTDQEKKDGLKRSAFIDRWCIAEVEKHKSPKTLKSYYEVVGYSSVPVQID